MSGPLSGFRIIEFAGLGPGPFAAMMLADHGAEVIRIDRPGVAQERVDPLLRSRRSITLDLKSAADVAHIRQLCRTADGLIEGYRPGVMERLGLGPDILLEDNPQLVYGRMTGWGQDGPAAHLPGHDINYIAISGALGMSGRADAPPTPALNLVGDFGGGGMMLAFGMLAALLAVQKGGSGQVIDCAMTDGSALLTSMMWGFRGAGRWSDQRGTNMLDTGAPFYEVYRTKDDRYVAVGCIEPRFYTEFRRHMGIAEDTLFDAQHDQRKWPAQKERLAELFAQRTRDEWCDLLWEKESCFSPVMSMSESLEHPHNLARNTFIAVDGVMQPAPAPRYSVTQVDMPRPQREPGADSTEILGRLSNEQAATRWG